MGLWADHPEQWPVDAVAAVDVGERPPSEVWREIAASPGFQDVLAGAVRELLADVPHWERWSTLVDAGVDLADGMYAAAIAGLDRGRETGHHQQALQLTEQFGTPEPSMIGHLDLDDLRNGPLAVLEAAGRTPTIAVRIDAEAFSERGRQQREDTCSLLALLGTVCEVRLVGTDAEISWLALNHHSLPAEFTERVNARRELEAPTHDRVDAALDRFEPDSREVRILRLLAEEPDETLPQKSLVAAQEVGKATVSVALGELEDLDLVERYSYGSSNHVELRPAGSAFLDALDEETAKQTRLDRLFADTGHGSSQAVNEHAHGKAPPDAGTEQQPLTATPYRTRYLSRAGHAAAAGAATDSGVTAVNALLPDQDDMAERRTRYVSYDADRDETVVAVRATGPLQHAVSTAISLASPRLIDKALSVDRLEDIEDPPAILRDARCIGCLSSEAENDPEVLRDALVDWGKQLASMTTKLQNGEYEDRDRFRGAIMRSAFGLSGTIVHLLDVAGVDLVREIRVPDELGHDELADIARSVSITAAIESQYESRSVYRQLFEQRDRKRETAFGVTVDADDPLGTYIGALVVRGPEADKLGQHIEGTLSSPAPVHEDAPEIAVRVPVTTPDRSDYAEVVSRMCGTKNLRTSREAVTLYRSVSTSPYAVAEAINWLGSEERSREIRLDEVRVSLARLDTEKILEGAPPSISKALIALLRSTQPLTQAELAEAADISTRSLRRHLDVLQALDLVTENDGGLRFVLPFATDEERGAEILPQPVNDAIAAPQDLVFDVVEAFVDDPGRLGDPDDLLYQTFSGFPPDLAALRRELPDVGPWVQVARHLCDTPDPGPVTVEFGAELEQTSLQAAATAEPGG